MGKVRGPRIVALALASAVALGACTATSPVEPPSSAATTSSTTTPLPDPTTTSGSPEPTPSESAAPTPAAPVALSADGIGDLVWGEADAADVEALLGPADSTEPFPCAPETIELSYGGLGIFLMDGTLYSWQTDQRSAMPTTVSFPDGISPGDPLSGALALPGAGDLTDMGPGFDLFLMEVQRGGAETTTIYLVEDKDPSSPIVSIAAPNILACS